MGKKAKKLTLKDRDVGAKKAKVVKGGVTPTGTVTFTIDGVAQVPTAVKTPQTRQSSVIQDL